jgi:signal transduction histidine kinase
VLNKTNEEIRAYIYDLRRSMAGDEDLARGLLDIVAEFRLRTTTPVDWNVEGCGNIKLLPEQRQHVYQIVREALNNVAKHASATRATVELKYDDCDEDVAQLVKVQVSDNGKGAAQPLARPGRGLLNMRERAELLNAEIDVSSTPGKGTTVTLVVKGKE